MSDKNKNKVLPVAKEEAPEGFTFLWHPLKGRRQFVDQHAINLLKSEKTLPSGWEPWTNQTVTISKPV